MTNYSDIKGYRVKYLSSDPTLNTSTEGQVWYNSTSGTLKALVKTAAWSSASSLSTARDSLAGAGTQTAFAVFGGRPSPGSRVASTEEYNGFGWSSGGNLGGAKYSNAGTGSQTAALNTGGLGPGNTLLNSTEEYDGSTWTAGGAYPVSVYALSTSGIQTAALGFGGNVPQITTSAEYNGSAWTAGNPGNTARNNFGQFGTQTASIACGGDPAPGGQLGLDATESYDGTSWTTVNPMLNNRDIHSASGIQTSGIAFGGSITFPTTYTDTTEVYDGTSWTSSPATLATAVRGMQDGGGFADNTTAIKAAGLTGPTTRVTTTEEYDNSINTIVAGTWASGTNLPINTSGGSGGFGASYDSFALASPVDKNTYLYDGSTWTTGNPAGPVFSNSLAGTCAGTQTAAFMAGERRISPEADLSTAGDWDGTSWTAANPAYSQITAAGFGTQTAGGIAGGGQSGVSSTLTTTNLYDGTNWTSSGALNDGRGQMSSVHGGTQTAAIIATGEAGPPGNNKHEHFDGSTWTSQTAIPGVNMRYASATGTQTSYLAYAGGIPGQNGTYSWNGTAWVTEGNMVLSAYNRSAPSGQTSNANALAAGVQTAPSTVSNGVEEWTGPTTVAAASTLTTS